VERLFAQHLATVRGAVARPDFYSSIYSGAYDWEKGGADRMLRAVVHLDEAGSPDGYALFKHVGRQDDRATVDLVDLVALTPEADLRLWRFLADIDLVERVRWRRAPVTALPLEWALTDPRLVSTTAVRDTLWLRVLDVPVALAARPWGADGSVVLGVDDPLGHAAGSWRVTSRDGAADVVATDDEPGVRLAADVLGSLYLGAVDVATLRAAGRLTGDDAALDTWAAMADTGPAPYCTTGF
jgi:predicted acetyltransferase